MYESWSTPPGLGPVAGPAALCSPARRVAASSPRVQGWYNCVSAQRGAQCCLNINKLSHSRGTPALVTTVTRNTSPPAAAGGSFQHHFLLNCMLWFVNIGTALSFNRKPGSFPASIQDAQRSKAQQTLFPCLIPARLCSALYDSCNSI